MLLKYAHLILLGTLPLYSMQETKNQETESDVSIYIPIHSQGDITTIISVTLTKSSVVEDIKKKWAATQKISKEDCVKIQLTYPVKDRHLVEPLPNNMLLTKVYAESAMALTVKGLRAYLEE
ncbi:MAG: hypothetical protein NTX86_05595 [Candidatus Dependentiae bacterium]|nr:hypothetical protein [Candidatus Dependentiae bacterium]